MSIISQNIKYLRKKGGFTQEGFAAEIGVKRSMIGSYEENRAVPKLTVLQDISNYFGISMDMLTNHRLTDENMTNQAALSQEPLIQGKTLRVVSTVVDKANNELITVVPVQASAGYVKSYADPDFIGELPRFSMPLPELSQNKTYRLFQVKGDSMLPIPTGAYIICEFLLNWDQITDGKPYIVITKNDGIVYKRLYKRFKGQNGLLLKSDNPEYKDYTLPVEEITEIWKALGFISFQLPSLDGPNNSALYDMILELKDEIKKIKK